MVWRFILLNVYVVPLNWHPLMIDEGNNDKTQISAIGIIQERCGHIGTTYSWGSAREQSDGESEHRRRNANFVFGFHIWQQRLIEVFSSPLESAPQPFQNQGTKLMGQITVPKTTQCRF